jgi:hypothetical protein
MSSNTCTSDAPCETLTKESTYFRYDQNPSYKLLSEGFATTAEGTQTALQQQYTQLTSQLSQVSTGFDTALTNYQNNLTAQQEQLQAKNARIAQQQTALQEKYQTLQTRNRMLQVSQERTVYKQKLIYTLIALIGFFIILTIGIYFISGRKSAAAATTD